MVGQQFGPKPVDHQDAGAPNRAGQLDRRREAGCTHSGEDCGHHVGKVGEFGIGPWHIHIASLPQRATWTTPAYAVR